MNKKIENLKSLPLFAYFNKIKLHLEILGLSTYSSSTYPNIFSSSTMHIHGNKLVLQTDS